MAKTRSTFRCTECGRTSPRWAGHCDACDGWNTFEEAAAERLPAPVVGGPLRVTPIEAVEPQHGAATSTGSVEVDRVLGGGLVAGSVTLLGGEPGIGKSTLVLQLAAARARRGETVLYVCGEEAPEQVRRRAERLGAMAPGLLLAAETSLPRLLTAVEEHRPALVVVDSIQTLHTPEQASAPGSVGQVRECAHRLVEVAKAEGVTVVLVGHVTKEGALAGPRVLEHVVDTVLAFEGDRHHALRLLRARKHRFGSTSELGVFSLGERGLRAVADPSGLFLGDRRPGVPGSAVTATVEGHRPLLVEVQALVATTNLPQPRRSANGVDAGRLSMLLTVLERRAGLSVAALDAYALAVGGVRLVEPGADLALCLAVASSATDTPIPEGIMVCGEVGLGGEVRSVAQMERRLAEAARLGFTRAVVPASAPDGPAGLRVDRVAEVGEALDLLELRVGDSPRSRPVQPAAA